jgi:hypothetical protein
VLALSILIPAAAPARGGNRDLRRRYKPGHDAGDPGGDRNDILSIIKMPLLILFYDLFV